MIDVYQLITVVAVVLSAVGALGAAIVGWINRQSIQEIHLTMNSRLDQLVETTERLALARGAREALAEDKIERAKAEALLQQPEPKAPTRTWTWHEDPGHSEPEE